MRLIAILLAIIVVLCCAGILALAAEYHVKQDGTGDSAVIQDAIETAQDGDIVIVHPGTYYENIHFLGKDIILQSADPTNSKIVDSMVIDGDGKGAWGYIRRVQRRELLAFGTYDREGDVDGINEAGCKASITDCIVRDGAASSIVAGHSWLFYQRQWFPPRELDL